MTSQYPPEPDCGASSAAGWKPEPGDYVEIRRNGAELHSGTVEVASEDYRKVWLKAEGVNLRRLFDISEGYEIRPVPAAGGSGRGMKGQPNGDHGAPEPSHNQRPRSCKCLTAYEDVCG